MNVPDMLESRHIRIERDSMVITRLGSDTGCGWGTRHSSWPTGSRFLRRYNSPSFPNPVPVPSMRVSMAAGQPGTLCNCTVPASDPIATNSPAHSAEAGHIIPNRAVAGRRGGGRDGELQVITILPPESHACPLGISASAKQQYGAFMAAISNLVPWPQTCCWDSVVRVCG